MLYRSSFLFVVLSVFFLSSCERNNIHEMPNWSSYFAKEGVDSACFEIYDNTHDQVFVYNIKRSSTPYKPASTIKILSSLVALELNLAPDTNYVIPWGGVKTEREEWNKDLKMIDAFRVSSEPYYKELARRIGRDTMQHFIDTVRYGNKKIGSAIDAFWLDGSLLVTPDEQVGFLKKLYFSKLPFSDRTQRLVKSIMLMEETPEYKLYYKTGTYSTDKSYVAHLVGFIEKEEVQKNVETGNMESNLRPYFFSLSMETKDKEWPMDKLKATRVKIAKSIFKELKIIK